MALNNLFTGGHIIKPHNRPATRFRVYLFSSFWKSVTSIHTSNKQQQQHHQKVNSTKPEPKRCCPNRRSGSHSPPPLVWSGAALPYRIGRGIWPGIRSSKLPSFCACAASFCGGAKVYGWTCRRLAPSACRRIFRPTLSSWPITLLSARTIPSHPPSRSRLFCLDLWSVIFFFLLLQSGRFFLLLLIILNWLVCVVLSTFGREFVWCCTKVLCLKAFPQLRWSEKCALMRI